MCIGALRANSWGTREHRPGRWIREEEEVAVRVYTCMCTMSKLE